jgi:hypothetical protein
VHRRAAWTWFPATYNTQVGADDEFVGSLTAPLLTGSYSYTYRFTFDGQSWTYCDLDGAGANPALDFSAAQLGTMTVTP